MSRVASASFTRRQDMNCWYFIVGLKGASTRELVQLSSAGWDFSSFGMILASPLNQSWKNLWVFAISLKSSMDLEFQGWDVDPVDLRLVKWHRYTKGGNRRNPNSLTSRKSFLCCKFSFLPWSMRNPDNSPSKLANTLTLWQPLQQVWSDFRCFRNEGEGTIWNRDVRLYACSVWRKSVPENGHASRPLLPNNRPLLFGLWVEKCGFFLLCATSFIMLYWLKLGTGFARKANRHDFVVFPKI